MSDLNTYKDYILNLINEKERKAVTVNYFIQTQNGLSNAHKYAAMDELVNEELLNKQGSVLILTSKGVLVANEGYLKIKEQEANKIQKELEYQDNLKKIAAQEVNKFETKNSYSQNFNPIPINAEKFKEILSLDESSILDFKREMFDFDNDDSRQTKLGNYIKDVISMINTIRTAPAYIIVGVKVKEDKSKELFGLNVDYDDSMLQAKLNNKVTPRPIFNYYTITHEGMRFGVFEFPIRKYNTFLTATSKIGKVDAGVVYCRNGSGNAIAESHTIVDIHTWITGLPTSPMFVLEESQSVEISKLLKAATDTNSKLSEVIVDTIDVAKKYNLTRLKSFCEYELKGMSAEVQGKYIDPENYLHKHRLHTTMFSTLKVKTITSKATASSITQEIKNLDKYYEYTQMYGNSITNIEDKIQKLGKTVCFIDDSRVKNIEPDSEKDGDIYFYYFQHDYLTLYSNIRQALINLLISPND